MGAPVARIGDAISHGGSIVQGSDDVFCDGLSVARRGDAVFCALHGAQTIIGGSDTVFVNGRGCARLGDAISCGAVVSSGSDDVSAG